MKTGKEPPWKEQYQGNIIIKIPRAQTVSRITHYHQPIGEFLLIY